MKGLPRGLRQKDKEAYLKITPEGSDRYTYLNYTGQATLESETRPQGIAADDFNVFATMVYAFQDHSVKFDVMHSIRHIDVGTGPNISSFIANLPYADELIAVELAPANVAILQEMTQGNVPFFWEAWLELATVLHEIGSPEALIDLDQKRPDLYDQLRQWSNLNKSDKEATLEAIGIQVSKKNPYYGKDLKRELSKKLRVYQGDIMDNVESLRHLEGTADILTHTFLSESVTSQLPIVAHCESNVIQLAKEGALTISAHISKTDGYNSFFSHDELSKNPTRTLEEFPATASLFEAIVGQVVMLSDRYTPLWSRLKDYPEHRRMVRNQDYGSAVILCGYAHNKNTDGSNKYANGIALLEEIKDRVRRITVEIPLNLGSKSKVTVYCLEEEAKKVLSLL